MNDELGNQKTNTTDLLKKLNLTDNQRKLMPKYKKKFLNSYSKIGKFLLLFININK